MSRSAWSKSFRALDGIAAELLRPVAADARLDHQKLSQLDRLYQRVTGALDRLVRAVGLEAA